MKFLLSKDLEYSKFYAYLVASIVTVVFLYLLLDSVHHAYLFGVNIVEIQTTLYGNSETFEEPILFDTLLLQVHIDLFMTLFAVLILSSIYIRLHAKGRGVKMIVHNTFLLGAMTPLFLMTAYFVPSAFLISLWGVCFGVWHLLGMVMVGLILKRLELR